MAAIMNTGTWLTILGAVLVVSYLVRRRNERQVLQGKEKELLKLAFALRGKRIRATVAPARAADQFGDFLLLTGLYLNQCGAITGEANFTEPPEFEIGISFDRDKNRLKIVATDLQDVARTELKIDSSWPNTTQRELALEATSFLCTFERLALPYKLSEVRQVLDGLPVHFTAEPEKPKDGPPYPEWVDRLQVVFLTLPNHASTYGVTPDSGDEGGKPKYEVCLSYESQTDSLTIVVSDLPHRALTIRQPSRQWLIRGDVVLEALYTLGRFIKSNEAASAM